MTVHRASTVLDPPAGGGTPFENQNISETAAALLDAAESLFSTRGYDAVGIRDLAEAARANIASIKYHFGSKRSLYLATVRRSMMRRADGDPWAAFRPAPETRPQAAAAIVRFTHDFIVEALQDDPPRSCAMLMTHEALQPSEALDDVVREYIRPRLEMLEGAIRVLKPEASPAERSVLATSVLGQILYFVVFRAFAERMENLTLKSSGAPERISSAVASFSLRGLGVPADEIELALETAARRRDEKHS